VALSACGAIPDDRARGIRYTPEESFARLESDYAALVLERHPVVATYLGASGWRADLAGADARLRDFSESGLAAESAALAAVERRLDACREESLSPDARIDARVIRSQVAFLDRSFRVRRHHLRAVDTYVLEPYRGIEWLVRAMPPRAGGRAGSAADWDAVASRARAAREYLRVASENLARGVREGVVPDARVIRADGLEGAEATERWFRDSLPALAASLAPDDAPLLARVRGAAADAAAAYAEFRAALVGIYFTDAAATTLRPECFGDRFALGEAEYAWALRNNLGIEKTPRELFDESAAAIEATTAELIAVAREVAAGLAPELDFATPESARASVKALYSRLADDHPASDAEMIEWHRAACDRLVAYGREAALFDLPADYRIDVVETPPAMRSAVDGAVYFPAPIWKRGPSAGGRFYVTPTGDDPAALRSFPRAGVADLCAHEGFPGHDWHYRFVAERISSTSVVRTLLPGSVEDSSSMWADSMIVEGWALYAEELLGEPRPGRPHGAYAPEEKLFELRWRLLRDVRVLVDVGIHTGRMNFDEAVRAFTTHVHFRPDAETAAASDPDARNALAEARRAIARYAKWPTQAVTYALGKRELLALTDAVRGIRGERFDPRAFHESVLSIGLVPISRARESLLERAAREP